MIQIENVLTRACNLINLINMPINQFRFYKLIAIIGAISVVLSLACAFPPGEKSLSPRLLFSSGAAFIDSAGTAALKGTISFEGGKAAQSGSFQLFLAGRDSLSFLVEGPLGADIFRMIIAGDSAFLLSNKDEGWIAIRKDETVSLDEFGIDNISPFLLGLYAFPQYYLHNSADTSYEYLWRGDTLDIQPGRNDREFLLIAPRSLLAAAYSRRRDFANGFYPSSVKIFIPGHDWEINLGIDKIIINPGLPQRIWNRG
jgi:hypothetical protein